MIIREKPNKKVFPFFSRKRLRKNLQFPINVDIGQVGLLLVYLNSVVLVDKLGKKCQNIK